MSDVVERDIALEAAEMRAAAAEHRLYSARQYRAARSRALAEFIKSRAPELWADYAALSVNGSVYSDESTIEPTYERELNIAVHRAEKAEEEAVALRAQITRLRAELASAVAAERERCARVAEGHQDYGDNEDYLSGYNIAAADIAAAIREGG